MLAECCKTGCLRWGGILGPNSRSVARIRERLCVPISRQETIVTGKFYCLRSDRALEVALPLAAPLVTLAILLTVNLLG